MNSQFDGLTAIVQYRRKPEEGSDDWHNMAAFDSRDVADRYAEDCAKNSSVWDYQVIDAITPS